ncbi:helix-turn-helix domain-containing protein [Gordonia sp. CPCC 205333]|uniref:helix-turn-helix domain-containing protein n=1 Tax=Gordonia sp. CPCC 205333 TaxID=3140790 RepID=UPI003AF33C19
MTELSAGETRLLAGLLGSLRARARYAGQPLPAGFDELHMKLAMSAAGHQTDSTTTEFDMIDSSDAARILGLSPRHIRRIAADLEGRKTGRQWMFPRRAIETIGGRNG